jgi:hypothetical protein
MNYMVLRKRLDLRGEISPKKTASFVFFVKYYNDKIKEDDTASACNMGEKINGYKVFVGKHKVKRALGRSRHRKEVLEL